MPNDPLKALIEPNTGDLVGTWGSAAVNPNMSAIGGMLGGAQTLSLSSATTFALSAPSGSITPGAGPNQAQNAILKFTGTLTGNAVITMPLPGYYIINNACTVATSYIQLRAVGTGIVIGVPDGRQTKIWCDGTDVGFCDTPEVGSYLDLALSTTPVWMGACTNRPYLLCDGSIFSTSSATTLGQRLGSTYGGNGITTFAVPDLLNRVRIPLGGASGRVTNAGSGINGTTLGASGGSESLAAHIHASTINTTVLHQHGSQTPGEPNGFYAGSVSAVPSQVPGYSIGPVTATTGLQLTNATTGTGASANMPPALVAGIVLIKT